VSVFSSIVFLFRRFICGIFDRHLSLVSALVRAYVVSRSVWHELRLRRRHGVGIYMTWLFIRLAYGWLDNDVYTMFFVLGFV